VIDFWEMFGRLTTDDNLRLALLNRFAVGAYAAPDNGWAKIPQGDYDDARQIVNLSGPASIMGLGEILWCLSSADFRAKLGDLVTAVGNTGVATAGRSSWFYTALGLMSVDGQVLTDFAAGRFDDNQFGMLTDPERTDIRTLASNPDVVDKATRLCRSEWSEGCSDKALFWSPDAQHPHLHPVASPYPLN
jgi:hypothetical protein